MGNPILGYMKRSLPFRRVLILLVVLAISVVAGYGIFNGLKKELRIIDEEDQIIVKTMGEDVETVFNQVGVLLSSYDYVSVPLSMKLSNAILQEVLIRRAVPVNIILEGKTTEVMTYHETIDDAIKANGIVMGPLDRVDGRSVEDPIQAGMDIKIIRVREEIFTEEEEIPYVVIQTPNEDMNQGDKKVTQAGEEGKLEKYYKLTYEDGRIISKDFINEKIAKEPTAEMVEIGTVPNFKTSRGDVVRYTKVIEMEATAYTASFKDTGKHPDHPEFGICYTGMKAREGVIAVDPKVIPLYTKMYIDVSGKTKDYGFAIAGDIGSGIKGKQVDLYLDSQEAVDKWGRKKVKVYILKEQDDTRWKETDYIKND
jgi:uncharacterized protein YabE (DUF348 family)